MSGQFRVSFPTSPVPHRSTKDTYYSKFISLVFLPKEWAKYFPTLGFLTLIIASDLYLMRRGGALADPLHRVDHFSHLGGYMGGIAAGLAIKQRTPTRNRQGKPIVKVADKEVIHVVP